MAREDFRVTIITHSDNIDITSKRQVLRLKDIADCLPIERVMEDNLDGLLIDVESWIKLDIHNENAKRDKDYTVLKLIATDGQSYKTGSKSLIEGFEDIWYEIQEDLPADKQEPVGIKVFARESKNYPGKNFYQCRLV